MRMHIRRAASVALLLALSSAAALADKPARGSARPTEVARTEKTAGEKIREALPEGEMVFTEQERILVQGWFRENGSGLPPGLAKRDRLPPGLEKQLRQRGTLPPGLQKKARPLPWELERQLRRLPTGHRRVVIAGNVILMNEKTALIYDIIRNTIP